MKIGAIGLFISVTAAFCAGLGSVFIWKQTNETLPISLEASYEDLSDMRIMLYMDKEREYLLEKDGEIYNIDYAEIEDRDAYTDRWQVIRGGVDELLALNPTSSSGLYYIYRDFEDDISKARSGEQEAKFHPFTTNYSIALIGSSMNLALEEGNTSLYDSLVQVQTCFITEIVEGGNLLTFDENCFSNLKEATYRELGLK